MVGALACPTCGWHGLLSGVGMVVPLGPPLPGVQVVVPMAPPLPGVLVVRRGPRRSQVHLLLHGRLDPAVSMALPVAGVPVGGPRQLHPSLRGLLVQWVS